MSVCLQLRRVTSETQGHWQHIFMMLRIVINVKFCTNLSRLILVSSGYPRFLHSSVLLGNLLLVFGGNTHNDTSGAQKKSLCYSPDLMLYDTREYNYWSLLWLGAIRSLASQRLIIFYVHFSVVLGCNTWTKTSITKSLSSQAARFGHSAVESNG